MEIPSQLLDTWLSHHGHYVKPLSTLLPRIIVLPSFPLEMERTSSLPPNLPLSILQISHLFIHSPDPLANFIPLL